MKSRQDSFGKKIVDGAYKTLMKRLQGESNPSLFLLNYDAVRLSIVHFLVVPKQFFVPEVIEKRPPLAATAHRAHWVGCNILLSGMPEIGRIYFVHDRKIAGKEKVIAEWRRTLFLREAQDLAAKGWLLDVMRCIDRLGHDKFTLHEVYGFETELARKHPENRHVKEKIRQQLQLLRDKGYLHFLRPGEYSLG